MLLIDDIPAKIISRRHLPETEKFTIQQLIVLLILLIYVILTAVYQINQSVYNLWLREKSLSSMSWEEETWYLVWLTKKDLLLLLLNQINMLFEEGRQIDLSDPSNYILVYIVIPVMTRFLISAPAIASMADTASITESGFMLRRTYMARSRSDSHIFCVFITNHQNSFYLKKSR